MSGVVPYLIRAYCDWIEDSSLTPHILVDCKKTGVIVPKGFTKEGKIVLNVSSSATENRLITNDSISFKARFSGRPQKIIVPCEAVLTIYAQENGEGMFFGNKFETKDDKNDGPNLTVLD
jgi:stringent starvation protein B